MDRSGTADADMDVIGGEELGSKLLQTLGKGRREQQVAMITIGVCIWNVRTSASRLMYITLPPPDMILVISSSQSS